MGNVSCREESVGCLLLWCSPGARHRWLFCFLWTCFTNNKLNQASFLIQPLLTQLAQQCWALYLVSLRGHWNIPIGLINQSIAPLLDDDKISKNYFHYCNSTHWSSLYFLWRLIIKCSSQPVVASFIIDVLFLTRHFPPDNRVQRSEHGWHRARGTRGGEIFFLHNSPHFWFLVRKCLHC